jgi:hypothetical protein
MLYRAGDADAVHAVIYMDGFVVEHVVEACDDYERGWVLVDVHNTQDALKDKTPLVIDYGNKRVAKYSGNVVVCLGETSHMYGQKPIGRVDIGDDRFYISSNGMETVATPYEVWSVVDQRHRHIIRGRRDEVLVEVISMFEEWIAQWRT